MRNIENDVKSIKVKYFSDPSIAKLQQGDWIDLMAEGDIELKKGDFDIIPLGVAMEPPRGYEALLVPRSSTFKKYGIIQTNGIGIIDESYCGDNDKWGMPVYATRDTLIHRGDRIAQFRIIKHQPEIAFVEVEHLGNTDRGGFGSTGV